MIAGQANPATPGVAPRRWTFAEMVAELPESTECAELWDGELIMSPSPSFFHQEIVVRFHDELRKWVTEHRLGKTGLAPLDMILSSRRVVQPDVFFVSHQRMAILTDRLHGAPDLVVEVLSPDSRRRDRIDKRDLYEQHGVTEYWLVDPEARSVEVLFLRQGEYHLAGRWHPGDRAASALLPGFGFAVEYLFGPPDPNPPAG
ncbi:MAG: Uma2 family endonuclease [Limisphaerales bacterium]